VLTRYGIRRHDKIFAVGFNKTGTSSLHALFKSLGLLSYHGSRWRSCENVKLLKSYDCFSDDIPKDLGKLDELFPRSKFILQVRELDAWVYSRLAHIARAKAKGKYISNPFWDMTEGCVKYWILQRNSYHAFVLDFFSSRPEDLLVINFIRNSDAASLVSHFLGFSGSYDRPKKNLKPSKPIPLQHIEIFETSVRKLYLSTDEVKNDILCPSLCDKDVCCELADTRALPDGRLTG
jgi:hypothetical protein